MARTATMTLLLLPLSFLLLLLSGMVMSNISISTAAGGEVKVRSPCKETKCLWKEEEEEEGMKMEMEMEMEMESETSRRMLWVAAAATQKTYISYEALKGDVVPCTKPGVPYYNCHALPKANPYNRGCQIISGCRGGSP